MNLQKTKALDPATVQNLKETALELPHQLDLFFRSLLGNITPTFQDIQKGAIDRKVTSMASAAIFNVSHGSVKPWKHTVMGLGLASLTGCRLSSQILNRAGHIINCNEAKGLDTEFAYFVSSDDHDAPDGVCLHPATASVWNNNDAIVETVDGKATLHSTVGHTYQNLLPQDIDSIKNNPIQFREGRKRTAFHGNQREIHPFRKPLKAANFYSTTDASTSSSASVVTLPESPNLQLKVLDLYWFLKMGKGYSTS